MIFPDSGNSVLIGFYQFIVSTSPWSLRSGHISLTFQGKNVDDIAINHRKKQWKLKKNDWIIYDFSVLLQ